MFWKVVVWNDHAFGFLFLHDAQLHADGQGCELKERDIQKCLVAIKDIEQLANIDLFSTLEAAGAAPSDISADLEVARTFFGD